jgi:outer membrane protein TolC
MRNLPALGPLFLTCALFGVPRAALAEPAETPGFEARLDAELGVANGLTSNDVVQRALDSSFDIAARKAELVAAAADADRALLGYLPELSVAASYTRLSDVGEQQLGNLVVAPGAAVGELPPGAVLANVPIELQSILNQYALTASLLVPVSDYFLRVAPARSAAEHSRYASSANLDTTRARVATDARVSYYTWVRAKLAIAVAEQALADAQAHLSDSRIAEQAGAAAPADTLRLESQVARSELFLVNTKSLAAVSEEQVRTHLHDESGKELRIGEDIRRPLVSSEPTSSEVARLQELWRDAVHNRPELRAAQENALAVSDKARVERAGALPKLDLSAGAAYADPNPRVFPPVDEFRSSWQVGARLSWSITEVPLSLLRADASDARSAALSNERSALIDRIRVEVRSAAHALDDSSVALDTTARGLAAAEESYRVRRISYQNGASSSVELLDAETDLTRVRLERLNAEVDARVARARFDYAIGRALP